MCRKAFNDHFARRDNFLTKIDARLKVGFVVSAILLLVSSSQIYGAGLIVLLAFFMLLMIKIPLPLIFIRMLAPLLITSVLFGIHLFMTGETPIFFYQIFNLTLVGYQEGFVTGILIVSKVYSCLFLIMFLSMTTPMNRLLCAAYWFRIPQGFIEVFMLSYRYIFVLLEDAVTVMNAQQVRLGYCGYLRSFQSMGTLAGTIVIRAYDQSIATYESMLQRGFTGKMPATNQKGKLNQNDLYAAMFFLIILIVLVHCQINACLN